MIGCLVVGTMVTESWFDGTPAGFQLPAVFQSVEMAPVHVRATADGKATSNSVLTADCSVPEDARRVVALSARSMMRLLNVATPLIAFTVSVPLMSALVRLVWNAMVMGSVAADEVAPLMSTIRTSTAGAIG